MRVVFIGTGEIGVPTLRALQDSREHELAGVVTQPDKPVGRDQQIQAPPIKAAVAEEKISILQPARIKDRQAIEEIRALQPDVIVAHATGSLVALRQETRTIRCCPTVGPSTCASTGTRRARSRRSRGTVRLASQATAALPLPQSSSWRRC